MALNSEKIKALRDAGYRPSSYDANKHINQYGDTVKTNGSYVSFDNVKRSHNPTNETFRKNLK